MTRKNLYAFSKRAFLNPASTHLTSYIQAYVQTGDKWGDNTVLIADCKRLIQLEFLLGTKRHRHLSLAKIDLLIEVLTQFRAALAKEIQSIEATKSHKVKKKISSEFKL
ncbi:MAG TPA: hypothetical protein VKB05_13895 [Pyrinomonadaceae bacterium]|nr:hypothetical protein [Pyrinomonadaceae bacterium]